MRITLVFPNPSTTSPQKSPALALFYVGERARQLGHEITYCDQRLHSKFHIQDAIRAADVVGISSQTGEQLRNAMEISRYARDKSIYRVMGGVHPTFCPAQLLSEGYADVVVMGEGEEIFAELLTRLEKKELIGDLPGVALTVDGGLIQVNKRRRLMDGKDIISPISEHTLPFFIEANKTNDVTLPSSRGCIAKCGFCFNCEFNLGKWRSIPVEFWKEQLLKVHKVSPIHWIQPVDDWMGPNKRVMEVGAFLHGLGILWKPSIRADQVDDELAEFLAKHGCTTIALGVESGSDAVLKELINKGETTEDIIRAAESLARFNVQPMYSFMLGFPGETKAQLRESFDFADKLRKIHKGSCLISFYSYAAFPGTPLYDKAVASGRRLPKTTEEWSKYDFSTAGTQEERNVYHIAGFTFQGGKRGKTAKNFPGWRRLVIAPWELLCRLRWKIRYFKHFDAEHEIIQWLLKWAANNLVRQPGQARRA